MWALILHVSAWARKMRHVGKGVVADFGGCGVQDNIVSDVVRFDGTVVALEKNLVNVGRGEINHALCERDSDSGVGWLCVAVEVEGVEEKIERVA
ncbi:hypothetical protein RJT34_14156 [Clitoria ternatea]|uniref:Uncharacterized protein n=1 Tax=Clitoria ternatea TaxID=43366 RepID=A0AAN9JS28_CLITE